MKFISHKILKSAVLLAALGSFATCGAEMQQPSGYSISGAALSAIEEDNRAKENYLVIDVRSAEEYAAGHIKHAINIPLGELESRLDEINAYKDKNVVLYCNTGNRSSKALDLLKQKGFSVLMNAPGVKQYDYELYKVGSINAEGFLKIANNPNVLIIDARQKQDYDAGHMKGAINIPYGEPLENYKDVLEANKDKRIITHCYSGNRSAKLAKALNERGYNVTNLLDGTKEYNYELVK